MAASPGILIIDDDIWMQRILSKTLDSYGFKEVHFASNGFEGIALAVEHKPSMIILDILMPELSGHLTLQILKHIKITRNIPVIMVSAMSDSQNLGKAVKSGTNGFISKPFTRATIYDKLVSVFGKHKLDMIAAGKYEPGSQEDISVSSTGDLETRQTITGPPKKAPKPKQKKATKEQSLKNYQEDEKKSIESIKKLLLRTRK